MGKWRSARTIAAIGRSYVATSEVHVIEKVGHECGYPDHNRTVNNANFVLWQGIHISSRACHPEFPKPSFLYIHSQGNHHHMRFQFLPISVEDSTGMS